MGLVPYFTLSPTIPQTKCLWYQYHFTYTADQPSSVINIYVAFTVNNGALLQNKPCNFITTIKSKQARKQNKQSRDQRETDEAIKLIFDHCIIDHSSAKRYNLITTINQNRPKNETNDLATQSTCQSHEIHLQSSC